MDETYRMLGREHELDLEREADRRGLAAAARADRRAAAHGDPKLPKSAKQQTWVWRFPHRLAALLR